ncbi:hypothetical protein BJV74DRAFT_799090 [Russula compacta]|nr:hypothetical protein BJV74DRAFT_799090 [Russula compacta]
MSSLLVLSPSALVGEFTIAAIVLATMHDLLLSHKFLVSPLPPPTPVMKGHTISETPGKKQRQSTSRPSPPTFTHTLLRPALGLQVIDTSRSVPIALSPLSLVSSPAKPILSEPSSVRLPTAGLLFSTPSWTFPVPSLRSRYNASISTYVLFGLAHSALGVGSRRPELRKRPTGFVVTWVRWNVENRSTHATTIFTNAGDAFTGLDHPRKWALAAVVDDREGDVHREAAHQGLNQDLVEVGEVYHEMVV